MNNLHYILCDFEVINARFFNRSRLFLTVLWTAFSASLFAQIPAGYYDSANGLQGIKLQDALHKIIVKGHIKIPYRSKVKSTWDVLIESDMDSANSENVILFYTGKSVNATERVDDKLRWNREHVWAISHGKYKENSIPYCDLHNLKPSKTDENNKKGTKDFDNGGNKSVSNLDGSKSKYDTDSWEPRPQIKGDVARILFYMSVRYEGDDGNPDLELVDLVNTKQFTIDSLYGCYGKLSTLLAWNKEDPVSSFERRRNEVIFKHQGNRNPFIDHPEFADRIWGNGQIIKNKNPGISNQQNKPWGITSGEFSKMLNQTCVILNKKGEQLREFEFAIKSGNEDKELRPGKYILKIKRDGKEQTYKVTISK